LATQEKNLRQANGGGTHPVKPGGFQKRRHMGGAMQGPANTVEAGAALLRRLAAQVCLVLPKPG
jgi:hypothetical protein